MSLSSRLLCLAAAAALMVSCSAEVESYPSVASLADGLSAADFSCGSVKENPAADLVKESAICQTEDGELRLFVFRNSNDRDDWKALGTRFAPTALGPNWAVSGSREQIEQISDGMHATVVMPERND